MRLQYSIKFWFKTLIAGFIGVVILSYIFENPLPTGFSGEPNYIDFISLIFRQLPLLFLISVLFFPIGFALYNPYQPVNNKTSFLTSLVSRNMLIAYITTLLTGIGIYIYIYINLHIVGIRQLFAGGITAMLLIILIPMNLVVWITCIRKNWYRK